MSSFINNRFVDKEDAVLHVSDLSMQRAFALFDFFRTVNAKPLFMEEHLQRFFNSAAAMHLPVAYSKEELQTIIHQLIQQSQLKEAGIRLMLTGGYSPDTYHTTTPNLVITCNPVKTADDAMFQKGITAITYEHQRELPHVKSINYLTAVWLQPLLKEMGADDVLYHSSGVISEFPRANVFAVIHNTLVTPAHQMLKGITRKQVLAIAGNLLPVEERDLHLDELKHSSELFLTSTTRRIMPVLKINDQTIGNGAPGSITTALYHRFLELEKQAIT